MFEFFQPKISAFGIDLSDLSVKIVDLKKNKDDFSLAAYGRTEIPAGLIEDGEIKKEEELIKIIKKAIREINKGKIRNKYCVASLPETESFVRVVELPAMSEEEAAAAVKWEVEAQIPLSLEEIYYDWQIIKPLPATEKSEKKKINVLIGALPKKTVDPYLAVFKKAGLHPFVFEIESIATARALIKNGFSPTPVLIIDIGAKRTSILIFYGQAIYFTSSLPISNQSLVAQLSEDLGVTKQKANEIKLKVGLDDKRHQSQVFESLRKPLLDMTSKIKVYLDYFREHVSRDPLCQSGVEEVFLCGGGANLAGLGDFLSSELELKVGIGNPWVNILNEETQTVPETTESLGYVTALGLALRGQQ